MKTVRHLIGYLLFITVAVTACNAPSSTANVSPDQSAPNNNQTPPSDSQTPPNDPTPQKLWSNPATWGGTVPGANSSVTIPVGQRVVLDSSVTVKNLTVLGTLEFAGKDLELTSDYILLRGALRIGTLVKPFEYKATITLTGSLSEDIMNMGSRGILVMGGKLELYGKSPLKAWTKLADHAAAGATNLALLEETGWKAGDQIVVAPTDFYDDGNRMRTSQTEQRVVSVASSGAVTLTAGLAKSRWGKLQYATDGGMSLTPGAITLPQGTSSANMPTLLDERAEVGNLTRNIVVQGADDVLWQTGFGAQVMTMDRSSNVQISGVELRRMGQAGKFGRYPIHFHNLSYDGAGKELNDVSHSVRNSVVWNSSQRCMVLHGSSGITLQNNICYDIKGHAIFLEDAVERRNVIEGNLVLKVREPLAGKGLLKHETGELFFGTSSAMWLTNPDNTVRGNAVADIVGHGYWLAFPHKTLGFNDQVSLKPSELAFGIFENNVAHTVQSDGFHLDSAPLDSTVGELESNMYDPRDANGESVGFTVKRITVYKNGGGNWNSNVKPEYAEWVSSDNQSNWFAGRGMTGKNGILQRNLVVANSLNVPTLRTEIDPLSAFASYHSTVDIARNLVVGFKYDGSTTFDPQRPNQVAGWFRTADYYMTGVDKGQVRNPNNVMINSSAGRRISRQNNLGEGTMLSGALWDPHGMWGPKNNYWVYQQPFYTVGQTCVMVQPANKNGMSCPGTYYGIGDIRPGINPQAENEYKPVSPLEMTRLDSSGAVIDKVLIGDGTTAPLLGWMRHFAMREGGRFVLRFPTPSGQDIFDALGNRLGGGVIPNSYILPKRFTASLSNLIKPSDSTLLGVAFDNNQAISRVALGGDQRVLQAVNSLSAVENGDGTKYYRDTAAQVVWIKLSGGFAADPNWDQDPLSDQQLYQDVSLEINR